MAAALVTLKQAKDHLYITWPDGDSRDADVQLKLDQAEAVILKYLKTPAAAWVSPETVPGPVSAAILLMLTRLYEHRGDLQDADADLWAAIDRLLKQFRDPALA